MKRAKLIELILAVEPKVNPNMLARLDKETLEFILSHEIFNRAELARVKEIYRSVYAAKERRAAEPTAAALAAYTKALAAPFAEGYPTIKAFMIDWPRYVAKPAFLVWAKNNSARLVMATT